MKEKIAVATISGKAYYLIVNELKRRNLLFLSLVPGDPVSSSIKVIITTKKEKPLINHPNILTYDAEAEPSDIVDEALRLARSREIYEEVTVGVDPGKTFGIAILGDRNIIRREDGLSLEKTLETILTELKKNPAKTQRVKIGSGIPELAQELSRRLRIALPSNVAIETVSEAGTSFLKDRDIRRKLSDADSALNIATKKGRVHLRGKTA